MTQKILKHTLIYFIQGKVTKLVKIGQTNCPLEDRMRALQTGSPDVLEFLGGYLGFKYSEIQLHEMFKDIRQHGEWFLPSKELTSFIKEHCLSKTTSLYYAHQKITQNEMNYEEALALGGNELCRRSNSEFLEIVDNMFSKDKHRLC